MTNRKIFIPLPKRVFLDGNVAAVADMANVDVVTSPDSAPDIDSTATSGETTGQADGANSQEQASQDNTTPDTEGTRLAKDNTGTETDNSNIQDDQEENTDPTVILGSETEIKIDQVPQESEPTALIAQYAQYGQDNSILHEYPAKVETEFGNYDYGLFIGGTSQYRINPREYNLTRDLYSSFRKMN